MLWKFALFGQAKTGIVVQLAFSHVQNNRSYSSSRDSLKIRARTKIHEPIRKKNKPSADVPEEQEVVRCFSSVR